ncbi:MAG: hypothetical protein KDD55_06315, partial [Bdellovibrionales bacterium]|nr:hypothetical protein [Bdellovibrionales bacterium]
YERRKLKAKAQEYCGRNATRLSQELGFGTQGIVLKTEHNTALKVYELEKGYQREKAVYKRLHERNIFSVNRMSIPRIVHWEDDLLAFEMSIVHVPCILDFGGAYVDIAPDHFNRNEEWFTEKREEFGKHWGDAEKVIREIEFKADIILVDVNPGNIKFPP